MFVDHKVGDVLPATRVVDFMPGKGLAALACSRMGIPYFGCYRNLAREIMGVHVQQIVEGFVSFRGCVRAFAWSGCLIEFDLLMTQIMTYLFFFLALTGIL